MMHLRTLSTPLVVILLLLVLPAAGAAELAPAVRIAVESQQPEVREQAATQAMAQILLRMTGRDDIAESDAAAPLLEEPGRFLQRYQYESQPGQKLMLSMQFNGTAVRQALAERGMPTWNADRPPVLVWLAVEQSGRRLLVGGEEGGDVRAELQDAAARRGVLLLFPLMDSEDRQQVGYADIFGGFTERVRQASQRYGAPLVVMGRMHRQGGAWITRWTLSGMDSAVWTSSGATRSAALDAAAAELATRLAAQYAVLPSAEEVQQLTVRIAGVGSLRDYDRLERRLRDISGVTGIRPLTLEPDTVVLQLALQTAPGRVLQTLRHDRMLMPVDPLEQTVGQQQPGFQTPMFRLIP